MTRPHALARCVRAAGPSRVFVRAESTSAAGFAPALPAGQDPAYDLALEYIASARAAKLAKLDKLKSQAGAAASAAQEARIARLAVEAWIDDPATRRAFAENGGAGGMERPVVRALARQRWARGGERDRTAQRVFQLGVVPDLLPTIAPRAALRIAGPEAGAIRPPSELASPPEATLQLFEHPPGVSPLAEGAPEALYTLLVIDADSPDHAAHAFTQRVHYAKTGIRLSVASGASDLFAAPGAEALPYEPPAPAQGSGRHRLVFVVVAQGSATPAQIAREGFELRAWLAASGLSAADVVAASLVRTEWTREDDQHVRDTWAKFRGEPAPVYGKPPKEMRYGYPPSAKQQRAHEIRAAAWEQALADIEAASNGAPEAPQQA